MKNQIYKIVIVTIISLFVHLPFFLVGDDKCQCDCSYQWYEYAYIFLYLFIAGLLVSEKISEILDNYLKK